MGLFRNFFSKKNKNKVAINNKLPIHRDENGAVHVVMHNNIFADVGTTLLASNSMYASLLDDIQPCVEPYSTNEKIVLDIYETRQSDDFSREVVITGFKKYITSCLSGLIRQHIGRFFLFFSFLLVGLLIEFILYGVIGPSLSATNPEITINWIFKSVEVLGTLFIWQFGGYLAFEFLGERKQIKRYKQIANVDFNIKEWN